MKTLLSFGHGYSARVLSGMLSEAGGWRIIGTTRSESRQEELEATGIDARIWPGSDLADAISAATHVLVSVAPDADGDPVLRAFSDQIAASAGRIEWVGYLSTTSVYGNRNGGWVDEESQLLPETKRGKYRVAAERSWQELAGLSGLPVHRFRLAGIYGPGRGPLHQLMSGRKRKIVGNGQYFNRIHVVDIARTLMASIQRPCPGAVYNVCDDLPATSEEVFRFAAGLTGLAMPKIVGVDDAELSEMARSFHSESKRVSNNALKSRLLLRLDYPDYKAGITALYCELAKG